MNNQLLIIHFQINGQFKSILELWVEVEVVLYICDQSCFQYSSLFHVYSASEVVSIVLIL